ncbi:hypothetical protein PX554_02770 [Sphingomonas sp. H39-1-10]|uniref:hypothetical protein n=1 Tax=Sphingomonas pollutisoli TaxID=3030829 RepID=UPI0023B95A43|nr:hypothetical protein [Sphingomonas pollutisoli]MDF0487041.1 hypothetical protein [Sphingomonas pollutisoli]
MVAMLANYVFAGLIGGIAGSVELLRRYRDDPVATLRQPAGMLYIGFNALSSLLAYHLVLVFDVRFGIKTADPVRLVTVQVLAAGLAAVAFFRTTLFTVRQGDATLEIGPSAILQVLLAVTDRSVDRSRALPRASEVPEIMRNVDFAKAVDALPAFCFGVMQNIDTDEQTAAREQTGIIARSTLSNALKANLLGLLLVNLVGRTVLRSAVTALGGEILLDPAAPAP